VTWYVKDLIKIVQRGWNYWISICW